MDIEDSEDIITIFEDNTYARILSHKFGNETTLFGTKPHDSYIASVQSEPVTQRTLDIDELKEKYPATLRSVSPH